MAENSVPSINLLPQKGESFVTQFLNWTLTIGRLLIILVEIVALGTFLYRFDLDMKIVDLHDKIKGQSTVVAAFANNEKNFRDIQDRLELVKRYDAIGSTTSSIFKDVTKLGEGKLTFRNLTVTSENVKIEAQAPSAATLSQFASALKTHPAVTAVTIDKVDNSTVNSLITVTITATLKESAFVKEVDPGEQKKQPEIAPVLEE